MLNGETIGNGAKSICSECKKEVDFAALKTLFWYVGTTCDCGPYSRETYYYDSEELCRAAFMKFESRVNELRQQSLSKMDAEVRACKELLRRI